MKKLLCLVSAFITFCGNAQEWHLTGNSGTTTDTNFIGTTDNRALMFKVNNQRSGYIDFGSAKANTSLGFQALNNLTGSSNTAIGYKAMQSNTKGTGNVAFGTNSMFRNTTGHHNVAVGDSSFYDSKTGSFNTAVGYLAMFRNVSGSENTAIGLDALHFNASGENNTAIGSGALYNNNIGYSNVAIGVAALYSSTTHHNIVAMGDSALYNNGVGSNDEFDGNENTAVGSKALLNNTIGFGNTANGSWALTSNVLGSVNTAIGSNALSKTNSSWNTAVGHSAGDTYDNGPDNVFVGAVARANAAGYSNVIAIGYGTTCTASNQVTMGNSTTTSYRAYANWSNISDGRYKKNVRQDIAGLSFINKLRPVSYTLDARGIDKFLHKNFPAGGNVSAEEVAMEKALSEKEQIRYTGFVAQEVEKAAKEIGFDFSGVDAAKNENDLYGLRYAEFVVPLVKAVQELSKMNDEKESRLDTLEKQNADLKERLEKIEKILGQPITFNSSTPKK
ncbi:MAG TPA: tail fiber domain-containing protein [Parafilimonas sp.]|nr:tail fiber domain-containing protein [Parafilimonas sp.]